MYFNLSELQYQFFQSVVCAIRLFSFFVNWALYLLQVVQHLLVLLDDSYLTLEGTSSLV